MYGTTTSFDGDAVANVHAPALRGTIADFGDSAEWFVTWHDRHRRAALPVVLFVVGTADAARFDSQECGVLVDIRYRNVARFERLGRRPHHRECALRQRAHRGTSRIGERPSFVGEFGAQLAIASAESASMS